MPFSRTIFAKEAKNRGHSDIFINEALEYAQGLINSGLPVIFSPNHLRIILGADEVFYAKLINASERMYRSYCIKKRSKGERYISSPFSNLKNIQKYINSEILSKAKIYDNAFAYRKNKSILDNASIHVNKAVLVRIDLLNFFDTITQKRVYGVFKKLGYNTNIAVDLAKITTTKLSPKYSDSITDLNVKNIIDNNNVLPQGAPTSPILSNLVFKSTDIKLDFFCKNHNISYSRYSDDLIFSGDYIPMSLVIKIKNIVINDGFLINEDKTVITKKGQKQYVTGLTTSDGVHVPKKTRKSIFRELHFLKKHGVDKHLLFLNNQHSINTGNYKDWLWGKICYINSIEPKVARIMINRFNEIGWLY